MLFFTLLTVRLVIEQRLNMKGEIFVQAIWVNRHTAVLLLMEDSSRCNVIVCVFISGINWGHPWFLPLATGHTVCTGDIPVCTCTRHNVPSVVPMGNRGMKCTCPLYKLSVWMYVNNRYPQSNWGGGGWGCSPRLLCMHPLYMKPHCLSTNSEPTS